MTTTMLTAGTYNATVELLDPNGERYTVDPYADPSCVVYRNGAVFTPTSVVTTQVGTDQVYKLAIAYTGLTIGDRIVIVPYVEMIEGQVIRLERINAMVAYGSGELTPATQASIDAIEVDTNELQTDLTDGGRLDLLIDAIKAVTDNHPNSGALSDLATLAARLTAARAGYLDALNGHTAQTGDSYAEVVKIPRAAAAISAGRHSLTNHDNSDEIIDITPGDPQ